MNKYIKALEGISYPEWVKLQVGMQSFFDKKISETKRELVLTDSDELKKAILQRFG